MNAREGVSPVHVVDFDHVVLNVADLERALSFYCDRLGLRGERVDEWRDGKAPFPSARVPAASPPRSTSATPTPTPWSSATTPPDPPRQRTGVSRPALSWFDDAGTRW